MTEAELHELAWRTHMRGKSDPFVWTGLTHLCAQLCVQEWKAGYRAALARQDPPVQITADRNNEPA